MCTLTRQYWMSVLLSSKLKLDRAPVRLKLPGENLSPFVIQTAASAFLIVCPHPCASLEAVRKHYVGLQSFRSMRRMDARGKKAKALRFRFSQSLANLRQRFSQAMVRSTIQRRGSTIKLLP